MNNPAPRAQEILERHAGRETYPGDPWVPRYGATKAVAEALGERDLLYRELEAAGAIFRAYEVIHLEKGTEDGNAKARSNSILADTIDRTLAKVRAAQGQAK